MLKQLLLGNSIGYRLFQNANGAGRMRRILTREYIRPRPGDRVLDIGCGTADIRPYLGRSVSYTGIDMSEPYIKHDQKTYRGDPSTTFIRENLNRYNPSHRYDIVLLMGVLHHISDGEARGLLSALPRVLRPGGRAITMDGCYTSRLNAFERALLRHDRGKFVRQLPEWEALFSSSLPEASYEIRKDLFYLPYNLILFQYRRPA